MGASTTASRIGVTSETDGTRTVRDTVRGSKNRTTGGSIKRLFGIVKALTQRAPKPAPPKKRRRSGEDDKDSAAIVRKHIRRLFRKIARKAGEDWREPPPTVDGDWWHWHQQSVADIGNEHEQQRASRPGPNYPSLHCDSPERCDF